MTNKRRIAAVLLILIFGFQTLDHLRTINASSTSITAPESCSVATHQQADAKGTITLSCKPLVENDAFQDQIETAAKSNRVAGLPEQSPNNAPAQQTEEWKRPIEVTFERPIRSGKGDKGIVEHAFLPRESRHSEASFSVPNPEWISIDEATAKTNGNESKQVVADTALPTADFSSLDEGIADARLAEEWHGLESKFSKDMLPLISLVSGSEDASASPAGVFEIAEWKIIPPPPVDDSYAHFERPIKVEPPPAPTDSAPTQLEKLELRTASRMEVLNKPLSKIAIVQKSKITAEPFNLARLEAENYRPIVVRGDDWMDARPNRYPVPFFYQPLYFEDQNLERCGNGHGIYQSFFSGSLFLGQAITVPFHIAALKPTRLVESPGDCPSGCSLPSVPAHDYTLRQILKGSAAESAAVVGCIILLL